jgi:hypothetical protein
VSRDLESVLRRVREDIAQMESNLAGLRLAERYLLSGIESAQQTGGADARNGTVRRAETGRPNLSQFDAAEKILRDEGKPLGTIEIVRRMLDSGYIVARDEKKRQQFINSIYSVMRRKSGIFVKVGKGQWGLVAWSKTSAKPDSGPRVETVRAIREGALEMK